MSVNESIYVGATNSQVVVLATAGTSVATTNPVVPAAVVNSPSYRNDAKALVSISAGGATNVSFPIVYAASGAIPTATISNVGLASGASYIISGLKSGDKLAFTASTTMPITISVAQIA